MTGARFETFKGKGKQPYRWRLVAANNEIIAQSEGYGSKTKAKRGAKTARCTALRTLFKPIVKDDG